MKALNLIVTDTVKEHDAMELILADTKLNLNKLLCYPMHENFKMHDLYGHILDKYDDVNEGMAVFNSFCQEQWDMFGLFLSNFNEDEEKSASKLLEKYMMDLGRTSTKRYYISGYHSTFIFDGNNTPKENEMNYIQEEFLYRTSYLELFVDIMGKTKEEKEIAIHNYIVKYLEADEYDDIYNSWVGEHEDYVNSKYMFDCVIQELIMIALYIKNFKENAISIFNGN